jgi:hypothetical protein
VSDFVKTINAAGIATIAAMIGLIYLVGKFIPAGPEQLMLMGAIAGLGAQTISSTRTPSTAGGTTKPAVQIAPAPEGTNLKAAAPVVPITK